MRWLIRSVLAVVVAIGLIAGAVFMIPAERVARIATDRFAAITGRTLTIEGSVRPSFWPTLGVTTGPVTISNADWSTQGPMLRAEALEISLDAAALLRREVKITGIRATAPQIVLERSRNGRENWVFGGGGAGGTATPGMAGEGTPFTLDLAEITDGTLSFIDHGAGTLFALSAVNGAVRIPSFSGPADVTLSAVMNGQKADLTAKIAQFAPFLEGRVVGVDLSLTAGAADVAFAGRAGFSPMGAEGKLMADLGDLVAITGLAGVARPSLPVGLGASGVTVAGDLTLTAKGSAHLRGGTVGLDGNRLTVEADLTTDGARPKLSAQVGAGALNLSLVGGAGGAPGTGGTSPAGWSTAPIDVSGMGALDASIALTADSVDLGGARFGPTRLTMTLDRARAVFDLRQIAAYQGNVSGQFVVNGRSGLSLGGDLVVAGVAMQPLLQDVADYDRLIGTGDLTLKFLAVGNSVDALMRGLSGSGSIRFGKGELRGLDLAGMLRSLDPGFVGEGQKTIFDGIYGSYAIEKGVLSNYDLTLKAPYVTATGSGTVGIGTRTLDYRLRPTALAEADGTGGVMVPLLITGTWAAPQFRLDLESLAKERLAEEAKALEARAREEAAAATDRLKEELRAKAEAELGLVQQDGESVEDAAKRRSQEALEAETGRLLNRLLGGN